MGRIYALFVVKVSMHMLGNPWFFVIIYIGMNYVLKNWFDVCLYMGRIYAFLHTSQMEFTL